MVSDTAGFDDKSFNQNSLAGLLQAVSDLGVEETHLQSATQEDYARNLDSLATAGCNMIVSVGFLLGDDTYAAATAHPEIRYAIVDYAYGAPDANGNIAQPNLPNLEGLVYSTNEGAMLAGYAAASWSKTKVMGTYGGVQISPVTDFMDGFVAGANYWNAQKNDTVSVLGWDPVTQTGSMTGNFSSIDDGKNLATGFLQENADVIMGVGGNIGQGAFEAIRDASADAVGLGVDVDWADTHPEDLDLLLTGVLKKLQASVFAAIQRGMNDDAVEPLTVNNLASGGVDLAPFHSFDSEITQSTKDEIAALKQAIIDGTVKVSDFFAAP
ncbi:MAG: BMP family ABC transporter substrate-binding protein [Chloroflexota bacterium]